MRARVPVSLASRLAPYPARTRQLVFASRYSTPSQIPPSSSQPTSSQTTSLDPGPKDISTPPEPPIEYSRKPREISSLSKNPWVVRAVKLIAPFMGYYSKTTTAIRETRTMYALCGERLEKEQDFLYKECSLPPTYQTWFQFTLIHVLILTARLRALPPDLAKSYQAELINHFFLDIEHRMRTVLGDKVPERIVKGYMKEMRDQWRGGGVAFDLGIVGSDATLAGMIWRNLFASRGAVPVAASPNSTSSAPVSEGSRKLVIASAEDAALPPVLYQFVGFVRREMARLEAIPDKDIAYGRIGEWGTVSSVQVPAGETDFGVWQATGATTKSGHKQAATA
ncbi:ubiquinol-cytochrome C chaperone domain-containing protein [Ceratobasidium sp. AG-Ba]|nr:ubiquinol-cytochrome C chaperone domain-containing protein [Ceratobasidium sp. AG-Ba]QRW09393.1 ubiquinol-cytochrome C chaperone domain-containing protein [Ceratobasidium sp. AG-Ba]